MGRIYCIEYDIPAAPNDGFLYACCHPTCRTHFVMCPPPGFATYYPSLYAVHFQEPVVNLVPDEKNENPKVDYNKVTKDLLCVGCNNKVGLKLITMNPDGMVIDERVLLLAKQMVVFNGGEGPQPQPIPESSFYSYLLQPQADPQADPQPDAQADPQADPQPDAQADPQPDPQADPLQPPAN